MNKVFQYVGMTFLSGIFLFAGLSKVFDTQFFYESLLAFKLGSKSMMAFSAIFLPWLEVFSALALWLGKTRRGALFLIIIQYLIFQVYLIQAWARDLISECPCFGQRGIDIRVEIFLNFIFLALSLIFFKGTEGALREVKSD